MMKSGGNIRHGGEMFTVEAVTTCAALEKDYKEVGVEFSEGDEDEGEE